MKKKRKLAIAMSLAFVLFASVRIFAIEDKKESESKTAEEISQELHMARLMFGGDVLPHINFDNHALAYGGGEYNYDKFFEKLKPFTSQADYFMLNCEFTAHPDREPSGFPMFNSNKAIYKSLAGIGVDVITTTNNHCLDTGLEGLDCTIDGIHEAGVDNVGTRKDPEKQDYLIKDINGIKVGVLAYAEQLNGLEYLLDTPEKKQKVDMIDPLYIKEDIESITREGAEFIVVYPHWGDEYSSYPRADQIELAHDMIDWGADMVIGNHPHVIQPREEYITADGRKGMIYYSLGNLISNQSHVFFDGDYRQEQGLLVDAIIYKGENDKKAKLLTTTYHSTWVETSYDDYGRLNQTYVIDQYLDTPSETEVSAESLELMRITQQMNDETMSVIVE